MQDFDIKIAPTEVRIIDMQADYIYYRAGSAGGADAAIEFSPKSGGESIFLYPGQAYRVPRTAGGMGFGWTLKNRKGEGTIIGVVILGEGEFQDNRISGSVEVIDGGKARAMSGGACMGYAYCGSVAGQSAHVQLKNPADSGVNIFLGQIGFYSGGSVVNGIGFGYSHPDVANFIRYAVRKKPGATPSKAMMRTQNSGTVLLLNGEPMAALSKQLTTLKFNEPFMIPPGYGMAIQNGTMGEDLGGTFEFFEELA